MTIVTRNNWTEQTSEREFAAAARYLSLLLPEEIKQHAVAALREAPIVHHYARDLLRASGLTTLPADNPDVAPKMRKLKKGILLAPVLLVRGDLGNGALLTIADGYHRICASYLLDETAEIPCRLAELPR